MVFPAGLNIQGRSAVVFDEAILKGSVMSDDQRGQSPTPVLRTRPATMLTAIGLCVFIMIIQLVPEFRDSGLTRVTVTTTTVAQ
jgi:hypothetical protein